MSEMSDAIGSSLDVHPKSLTASSTGSDEHMKVTNCRAAAGVEWDSSEMSGNCQCTSRYWEYGCCLLPTKLLILLTTLSVWFLDSYNTPSTQTPVLILVVDFGRLQNGQAVLGESRRTSLLTVWNRTDSSADWTAGQYPTDGDWPDGSISHWLMISSFSPGGFPF